MKNREDILEMPWTDMEDEKPKCGSALLVRLADGTITGGYVDSYGVIEPNGVTTNYDMSSCQFEFTVVSWLDLFDT